MPEQAKPAEGTAGGNRAGVNGSAPNYTPTSRFRAAALKYASAYGFRVLPLYPRRKDPHARLVPTGVKNASGDPDTIRRWWSQCPDCNVGVAGGAGLVPLDIDPRAGGDESLARLIDEHGEIRDTPMVLSGGYDNGHHLYFMSTNPVPGGDIAPGLTLKTTGYVVAPPSIHPDTGKRYEWEASAHIDDLPLAPVPGWIRALALERDRAVLPTGWAADWLRTPIGPGGRRGPDGIPKIVGYLRGHGIDCETAIAIIELWDTQNPDPLGSDEIRKHVEGMYQRYGIPERRGAPAGPAAVEIIGGKVVPR